MSKSPSFYQMSLCMLGHPFIAQPGNWKLHLSFNFLISQRLKARGENLGSSQIFSKNVHNLTYAYGLLDFQKYVKDFQSLCGHLIPYLFLVSFLLTYCLPQLLSNAPDSHRVKQFPLNVFEKCFKRKGVLHWMSYESGKIKTALLVVSSREPPNRSDNDNSLEMTLGSNSNTILHAPPPHGF